MELARLLDRNRLVTLTGAGGSGKTRLGLEAATARVSACPDGVWLVELAGLSDPTLVPAATASAVGLTLPSQRPALEGLSDQELTAPEMTVGAIPQASALSWSSGTPC